MPCTCWYEPPEASKRLVKKNCQEIVDELKRLHENGDPIGMDLAYVKKLLDHLWNPELCDEKPLKS